MLLLVAHHIGKGALGARKSSKRVDGGFSQLAVALGLRYLQEKVGSRFLTVIPGDGMKKLFLHVAICHLPVEILQQWNDGCLMSSPDCGSRRFAHLHFFAFVAHEVGKK